jgi:hypothetical protein
LNQYATRHGTGKLSAFNIDFGLGSGLDCDFGCCNHNCCSLGSGVVDAASLCEDYLCGVAVSEIEKSMIGNELEIVISTQSGAYKCHGVL